MALYVSFAYKSYKFQLYFNIKITSYILKILSIIIKYKVHMNHSKNNAYYYYLMAKIKTLHQSVV